jgi:BirA family biotin operon repressor/biotin-[acetyl-CoA-carboxylase] ligase
MALELLDSVSSTMDVARGHILSGRIAFNQIGKSRYEGVLAREQTAGRGQRGRSWYAAPGESLCATYYFRRGLTDPPHAGQIALLAGVAVAETLQMTLLHSGLIVPAKRTALRKPPAVGLKWPNDVLLHGKKVGGILIEMVKAPDGHWVALIGVGINLGTRRFPPEIASDATSLALAGVESCDGLELGNRIAAALHAQADVRRNAGFAAILKRWRTFDQTPGRRYQTQLENAPVVGVAAGIDDAGALRLRLEDGREISVASASSVVEMT